MVANKAFLRTHRFAIAADESDDDGKNIDDHDVALNTSGEPFVVCAVVVDDDDDAVACVASVDN